ncbi:Myc-type [Macleaya cordata]|uniref:Myc-type n=1 Tax=Macleaya cordata TaxID=56857 RepID=A0A200QRB0_MACCD|nr:Myc-type [Macleaya cordata]
MMMNSSTNYQQKQVEVDELLLDFYSCNNNLITSTPASPLLNTENNPTIEDFFYNTVNTNHLLPYYDPLLSFTPEIIPLDDFHSTYNNQYPKRQRSYINDNCYSDFTVLNNYFNEYSSLNNYPSSHQFLLPEFLYPPQTSINIEAAPIAPLCSVDDVENNGNKKSNSGYLSAQSVAARQRRRKISEKTQQLGKLIPGGSRMNTAEMFQAAFKYVKYLQAQVGILELMGSIQENKNLSLSSSSSLEVLLASTTIQEKLYSEEKCLIPKEFVEIVAKDHEIQSHPLISKDINSLVPLET